MRIFRRSLALAGLILVPALCVAAQASPVPRLGHRGRWITGVQGRVVIWKAAEPMTIATWPRSPAGPGGPASRSAQWRLGLGV